MRRDDGTECQPWVNISLLFFRWNESAAQNGEYVKTRDNNETLATIEKWLTYDWPETDRVQKAYDDFMQLLEANEIPIPKKDEL
jgi:hypothetical protein